MYPIQGSSAPGLVRLQLSPSLIKRDQIKMVIYLHSVGKGGTEAAQTTSILGQQKKLEGHKARKSRPGGILTRKLAIILHLTSAISSMLRVRQ